MFLPPVANVLIKTLKLLNSFEFPAGSRLPYEKNIPPLMSTLAPVIKLDAYDAR
jgi:hypothetical protein